MNLKQYLCKHNGSWTYAAYNQNIRVCLECGFEDTGWYKMKGKWIQEWCVPSRRGM